MYICIYVCTRDCYNVQSANESHVGLGRQFAKDFEDPHEVKHLVM